ncbi:MAG: phage major capsid protein [Deltaproteobacteria bacterium]
MGTELTTFINEATKNIEAFKAKYDAKFNNLETVVARREFSGGGSSLGDINTTASRDHKTGFLAYARNGSDPEGLRRLEIAASLSTDSNPDGGYLVPVEIDKNIERLALASVAMRRLATIKTSKGEYTKPLSIGGATGGWVAERATRAETDTPELTLFSPPMCEVYAMPSTTQKLLDMSDFDVEGWILEEINDVFVNTEGTGFITGNGVGQVHGILDTLKMIANSGWTFGKTGFITSGHASLINNADKIIDLQHALKPVYRANGTWLMNDLTFAVIRKLKDGNGNYIVMPGLVGGAPDFLLGRPVEIDSNMPDIGANTYPVAFGDFKRAYTIVDHVSGTRLLRDPYTKPGWVNFFVVKRIAGGVSNSEALKFLKIAA